MCAGANLTTVLAAAAVGATMLAAVAAAAINETRILRNSISFGVATMIEWMGVRTDCDETS